MQGDARAEKGTTDIDVKMAFSVLQIHLFDRLGDNITRIVDQYVGRELSHGRVDAMTVGNIQFGPRRSPYFVPLGQEEPLEGLGNAPIATSYKYFHEIQETKLLYCLLEDTEKKKCDSKVCPKSELGIGGRKRWTSHLTTFSNGLLHVYAIILLQRYYFFLNKNVFFFYFI